jgi:hypothetical protein
MHVNSPPCSHSCSWLLPWDCLLPLSPQTNTGQSNVCTTCVCSVLSTFAPALAAGGVTFNAAAPESFPLAQAAGIMRACAEEYLVAMLMAGVNVSALAEINNCNFSSATDVPACLAAEAQAVNGANATVTATSRTGEALVLPDTTLIVSKPLLTVARSLQCQ